jgi:hypothetical protein
VKKLYLYIRLSDADDDLKFKTESESIANQRTLLYRLSAPAGSLTAMKWSSSSMTATPAPTATVRPLSG